MFNHTVALTLGVFIAGFTTYAGAQPTMVNPPISIDKLQPVKTTRVCVITAENDPHSKTGIKTWLLQEDVVITERGDGVNPASVGFYNRNQRMLDDLEGKIPNVTLMQTNTGKLYLCVDKQCYQYDM